MGLQEFYNKDKHPQRIYAEKWPTNLDHAKGSPAPPHLHPDAFERVFTVNQKSVIAETFADLVAEPTDDVDLKLYQIRQALEKKQKRDFDFYDPDIHVLWDAKYNPWDDFVNRAKAYSWTQAGWNLRSLDYKVETGQNSRPQREAVHNGGELGGTNRERLV